MSAEQINQVCGSVVRRHVYGRLVADGVLCLPQRRCRLVLGVEVDAASEEESEYVG